MIRRLRNQRDLQASRLDNPNFAGTLAKGLMVLQAFVQDPRPHANSELAERLGMPRPTVSRLCRTLREMGFLDHDERTDRFFIGPMAITLGYPYVVQTPQLAHIRAAMQGLADQVGGAVSVGVNIGLDVVYIESCLHEQGTLLRPGPGAVRSVQETAMGRAWLSSLGRADCVAFLARCRRERSEESQRCAEAVAENLRLYKDRGFAVNLGDSGLGIKAVGVASRLRYGSRSLLFNCAVPGYRDAARSLVKAVGPRLRELVQLVDRLQLPR